MLGCAKMIVFSLLAYSLIPASSRTLTLASSISFLISVLTTNCWLAVGAPPCDDSATRMFPMPVRYSMRRIIFSLFLVETLGLALKYFSIRASSPWWAWPLNLKPVWFYQGSFAEDTAAAIYDAGNMVVWWMGIPAMCFVAYQAFRRRSLALALILIAFLAQWISWARIDRAAFQYHYYTSLPFVILALGYFAAEVWHGASRRTWQFARVAAAVALMGPVILWMLRLPLCALAGVESVNKGSQACNGNPGNLVVTPSAAALVAGILIIVIVLVRLLMALGRPRADGRPLELRDLVPLAVAAAVGVVALALAWLLPSTDPLLSIPGLIPEVIALSGRDPAGPGRAAGPHRAGRPTLRRRPDRRGRDLVRDPLPEHLRAPAAVRDGQRLPGAAADVPVPLPVLGEHDRPERGDLVRGPALRAAGRVPDDRLCRRRVRDVDLAPGAGGRARVRGRWRAGRRDGRGLSRARPEPGADGARATGRARVPVGPPSPAGSAGPADASSATTAGRGDGGTAAVKCGGRLPVAASRRITKP